MIKNYFLMAQKKVKAFSLVEIGVVLLVIGVLYTAVFKGKDLIDVAKTHAVASQIQQIQHSVQQYVEQYQAMPGDDPGASRFGNNIALGNGDENVSANEMSIFWIHLKEAGFSPTSTAPSSKFGGIYTIEKDANKVFWIVLSEKDQAALLTPKQALQIKTKLHINDENVQILNGSSSQNCLGENGQINIKSSAYACILKVRLMPTA
jgi:type II secretory pathway pseudopilin PulG